MKRVVAYFDYDYFSLHKNLSCELWELVELFIVYIFYVLSPLYLLLWVSTFNIILLLLLNIIYLGNSLGVKINFSAFLKKFLFINDYVSKTFLFTPIYAVPIYLLLFSSSFKWVKSKEFLKPVPDARYFD